METVIILSRKGGVGKTATAHALGAALMQRGKRVLFIDADGQCNLTLSMKADENQTNFYNVISQECSIKEAIQETENGYIIPGNEMLQVVDVSAGESKEQLILKEALKEVRKDFDYCIIDTPAALGTITLNCLIAADRIIIPLKADVYSLQGISRMINALEVARKSCGSKAKISGFLLTMYNSRTGLYKFITEELEKTAKELKTIVYESKIRKCIAIEEAALNQTDIFSYAPRSNAAIDYQNFVDEFVNQK